MQTNFLFALKAFISISLLILFISNNIFKAAIIFNYWQNKASIIANCCINKNKPELNCNGKCYVGSELDKLKTKNENNIPLRIMLQDFEMILLTSEMSAIIPTYNSSSWSTNFENTYTSNWMDSVFHPPTC